MSRQDEIAEGAAFTGLAAGPFAAWGPTNRQALGYGDRAGAWAATIRLNAEERERFQAKAVARAERHMQAHVRSTAIPGTTCQGFCRTRRMKSTA